MTVDLKALEDRIIALERVHYGCPDSVTVVDEHMRRARVDVEQLGLYSAEWKWVPSEYYTWDLKQRAKCLQVPSTSYLCKALLMENKKVIDESKADATNPKFVLIVIQYETTLDVKKLQSTIRKLRTNVKDRLQDSDFDFRIANEEDNLRITGYEHNSVSPFGFEYTKSPIPVILSKEIVEKLDCFYMGGGHVDLKLKLSIDDFIKAQKPIIADISQPRSALNMPGNKTKNNNNNNKKNNNSNEEKKKKKQEQKQKQKQQASASGGTAGNDYNISALDIRVGKILKVWEHEKADKLYCEEIDVGEENGPRQIASGLRPFYNDQSLLENQYVLVLCNLKKRNLVGFPSHGMVLCTSNDDHTQVQLVQPPEGSEIGERIIFESFEDMEPLSESQINKKKVFEKLAPNFQTNADGVVHWNNAKAKTSKGIITTAMINAKVA